MYREIGDLVEQVKHGVILQQVNAQGVMGSGIAKQIRAKWPEVWAAYSKVVTISHEFGLDGAQHLGKLIPVEVEPGLWVLNIVGQQYYGKDKLRRYTSYDALSRGFQEVKYFLEYRNMSSSDVHHPVLGCGLGGAYWPVVSMLIEHHIGPNTSLWMLPEHK